MQTSEYDEGTRDYFTPVWELWYPHAELMGLSQDGRKYKATFNTGDGMLVVQIGESKYHAMTEDAASEYDVRVTAKGVTFKLADV